MEIWTFDMDSEKVRIKIAARLLLAQQFQRGAHLLMRFGHHGGEHRSDAVLAVEPQRDVVALRIGGDEIVRKRAVVVEIQQARREDQSLAVDRFRRRRNVARRFGNPDRGNCSIHCQQRAVGDKIRKREPAIFEKQAGRWFGLHRESLIQ
jgi:hypothetical protein